MTAGWQLFVVVVAIACWAVWGAVREWREDSELERARREGEL